MPKDSCPDGRFMAAYWIPKGEWNDAKAGAGVGYSGFIGAQIEGTPIIVGIEGSYYLYGRQQEEVPLSVVIPEVSILETTDDRVMSAHFVLRLQWRKYAIKPFAEGLLGVKYFETASTLGLWEDALYYSEVGHSDTALSYGFGGGIEIYAGRAFDVGFHIHAGARYLLGSRATYLVSNFDNLFRLKPPSDVRTKHRSRTDALVPVLGLSFTM